MLAASPLLAQHEAHYEWDSHHYSISDIGSASLLGVRIEVKPLMGAMTGVSGFQVSLSYQDPFYKNSPETRFLQPSFFYVSCQNTKEHRDLGTYPWTNERKTRFEVHLAQQCKSTTAGGPSIPFLKIDLYCSNITKETRLLKAKQDGKVFDIFPTGYSQLVETEIGKTIDDAHETYEQVNELISTVLIILDLVAFSHGELTASEFIVKQMWGTVKGEAKDILVNAAFDYVKSQFGMEARFVQTGWVIICRVCGTRFYLKTISDGEVISCPNNRCSVKARMRFH